MTDKPKLVGSAVTSDGGSLWELAASYIAVAVLMFGGICLGFFALCFASWVAS